MRSRADERAQPRARRTGDPGRVNIFTDARTGAATMPVRAPVLVIRPPAVVDGFLLREASLVLTAGGYLPTAR